MLSSKYKNSTNENNRKRAGLLFHLLDKSTRFRLHKHLTSEEIKSINDGFNSYKKSPKEARRALELDLKNKIGRSHWPSLLFTAGMIFFIFALILHTLYHPNISISRRMEFFSPLFLGSCAPLAAYIIPPYRLHMLFQFNISFEKWSLSFVTFIVLLWLIVYIRLEETLPAANLSWLSLAILTAAAVSAPFAEEIFFREAFPSLIGNYPHYAGHLISAALFGLAHLPVSPNMGLLYFISALFLSVLRMNTDSLLYPYATHSMANVISLYV